MKHLAIAGLVLAMAASGASAQVNAGEQKPEPSLPFTMTQVTTLNLPWRIAFLPDGRMLITEKTGGLELVTQQGAKTPVANIPAVLWRGQGGMLGVYLSPHYAKDHNVYLTYSEPGERRFEPRACARPVEDRQGCGEPRRTQGHLARRRERRGRTVRRSGRLFSRRQVSLPLRLAIGSA